MQLDPHELLHPYQHQPQLWLSLAVGEVWPPMGGESDGCADAVFERGKHCCEVFLTGPVPAALVLNMVALLKMVDCWGRTAGAVCCTAAAAYCCTSSYSAQAGVHTDLDAASAGSPYPRTRRPREDAPRRGARLHEVVHGRHGGVAGRGAHVTALHALHGDHHAVVWAAGRVRGATAEASTGDHATQVAHARHVGVGEWAWEVIPPDDADAERGRGGGHAK
eukprot:CAMPEP_0119117888 /NCGR_PEP_ID=MMETSP1180-20130426/53093_1 /TAXON_ID=3052 ORGANISM="Chlamydomonas cf sp, Strain CCMP681" /NCGR_SAMPLE_ID=MMETSP1180 /ASSEMBLY_ACC=CAM_ASM_000741 /LENGTH=220 /DNA_ID=CAMNT_0007107199 /DNA_START=970 /DNA_END=1634 /DNA_ORIENTATION=+